MAVVHRRNTRTKARARGGPVLIVSAFLPELLELRRLLRQPSASMASARDVVTEPVGVGLVEAAAGAARVIARSAPRAVIFVGTAGAYAAKAAPPIGAVVVARRLQLVSAAVVEGDGYLPAVLPVAAESTPALVRALTATGKQRTRSAPSLITGDVATPVAITKSPRLAARLLRASGAATENLEAFSVARAAAVAGVPFAAVLGIANRVGPAAHAEWRRHGDRAAAAACTVVANALPALLAAVRKPAKSERSDPAPSRRAPPDRSAPPGAPARTTSRPRSGRRPA